MTFGIATPRQQNLALTLPYLLPTLFPIDISHHPLRFLNNIHRSGRNNFTVLLAAD